MVWSIIGHLLLCDKKPYPQANQKKGAEEFAPLFEGLQPDAQRATERQPDQGQEKTLQTNQHAEGDAL